MAARRLLPQLVLVVVVGFLATFLADGRSLTASIVADALANAAAIAVAALPVLGLCRRVSWRAAGRWWFVPVHVAAAAAFAQLWWAVLAFMLAVSGWLRGGAWSVAWLEGPARNWQLFTAVFVYAAVGGAIYAAQAVRDWREATVLRHEAEITALRAQLDPHLLFNTLHSLLELVRSGDARADDAIERFSRLARYVSAGRTTGDEDVPLDDEWRSVEDYLALESLRLGERLTWTLDRDPALAGIRLPALTLQPLVENAIVHGIAPRAGAGRVSVTARRDGDALAIRIDDDGLGVAATTHGSGRGLALLRRRLELRCGTALSWHAGPGRAGHGWSVALRVPLS